MSLTAQQKQWIVDHFSDTKNDVILQTLGISHSSLHRFAREAGLKKTPEFQEQCQLNASRHARRKNMINNWPPKGYIIPRSEEFQYKPGISPSMRLGEEKNRERIKRSAESRAKTFASERRRVLFGLPQRTKLKVVATHRNKAAYRYTLKKRGYIVSHAARTIFYDDNTNRSPVVERTATQRYHFEIKELISN